MLQRQTYIAIAVHAYRISRVHAVFSSENHRERGKKKTRTTEIEINPPQNIKGTTNEAFSSNGQSLAH